MAAILATVDIQDPATEKVTRLKDALTDLIQTQQAIAASAGSLAGGTQGAISAMGASASAAKMNAEEMNRLAQSYLQTVPAVAGAGSGIITFMGQFQQANELIEAQRQTLLAYIGTVGSVAEASRQGVVPLQAQAAALVDIAQAAKEGTPGLQQHAGALEAMATQLANGIPLTKEQAAQLDLMAKSMTEANRTTLDSATAMQALAREAAGLNAIIRENYQTLALLSTQLTAGQRVTKLQADALAELAVRAKEGNGFTKEQAEQVERLTRALQSGATVTKEQAAQLQNLTREYAETNKAALGFRDATEENVSGLERFKLAAAAVAAVLIEVGHEALSYAREATLGAARTEVLGTVMGIVTRNAHINNAEMAVQVERIKALGITTAEATNSVIKFVQAQLKVTDAAKLARVAQDLAVVAGTNSSQAFERLTHAIEAQSTMMLRQFGIVTSLHKVYADYAKEVGKSARDLDEADKKQAFLNKVLEEGAKFAGTYEAAMGRVGKQFTSLDRLTEEVADRIGDGLLPIFGLWVRAVTFLTEGFLKLDPALQRVASAVIAVGGAMAMVGGVLAGAKLLGVLELLEKIPSALKAATLAFQGLQLAADGAVVAAEGGGVWAALVAFFGGPVTAGIVAVTAAIGLLVAAFVLLNGKAKDSFDELQKEYGERMRAVEGIEQQVKSVSKLRGEMEKLANARKAAPSDTLIGALSATKTEEYNRALASLEANVGKVDVAFDKVNGTWRISSEALDELKRATDEERNSMLARARAAETEALKAFQDEQEETKRLAVQHEILRQSHGNLNTVMEMTNQVLAANSEAILKNKGMWSDLSTLLVDLVRIGFAVVLRMLELLTKQLTDFVPILNRMVPGFSVLMALFATSKAPQNLHELTSQIHIMAEALNGGTKALEEQAAAQRKAGTEAKTHWEELKRFANEIDPAARTNQLKAEAEKARNEVLNALFPSADKAEIAKRRAEIQRAAGTLYEELLTGRKKVNEAGKVKIVDIDPTEFAKIQAEIEQKLDAQTKAGEAAAKKMANALKSFRDSVRDNDPIDMAKFREAAKLLTETGMSAEEYARRVQRLKPILDAFAKSTDPAVRSIGALQIALNSLSTKAFDDAMEKGILANQKLAESLAERSAAAERGRAQELVTMQIAQDEKLYNLRRQQTERIEAVETSLWEREHLGRMKAVDQALYAEDKRIRGILKAYQQEAEARDHALALERAAVDRRAQLAKEEIQIYVNKVNREAELQLQLQRNRVAAMQPGAAREIAEAELRAAEVTRMLDLKTLQDYQNTELGRVEAHRKAGQSILDKQAQVNADLTASSQALASAQIADSRRTAAEIRKAYDLIHKWAKDAFNGIVSSFVGGLAKMADGAASFKDVLKGIWQDIKNSLFSLFGQILQEWLKTIGRMAAAKMGTGGLTASLGGFLPGFTTPGLPGTQLPAPTVPGTVAKTGFGTSLMSGVATAGVGGLVGYGVGSQFNTRTGGALAGAASGAATGALMGSILPGIGNLVGAAIGGLAGLVGGIFGGGKQAREVAKARDEYLQAKGGLEALKAAAEDAGVSIEKLMNTRKTKEFEKAVKELEAALELKKAKDALGSTYDDLRRLDRQAQLVGYDIRQIYDAKTIGEFNAKQAELNKLLDEQKKRLEGLQETAQGAQQWATGFAQTLQRGLRGLFPSDDEFKKFQDKLQEARDKGFTGTIQQFLAGQTADTRKLADTIRGEMKKIADEKAKIIGSAAGGALTPEQQKAIDQLDKDWAGKQRQLDALLGTTGKLDEVIKQGQQEFNALGLAAATTFAQIVHETGDIVQAMNAIAPTLDTLIQAQKDYGFEADAALGKLLKFRTIIKDNEDIFNSLSGITQVLNGLSEAGALTAQSFTAFGDVAAAKFEELKKRTGDADLSLLAMQPTIQALWEAQEKFGIKTDEATQALIDQGVQQGIVGPKFMDVNERILDVLGLIAQVLGVMPAKLAALGLAGDTAGTGIEDGMSGAEDSIERVRQRALEAKQALRDMQAAGVDAGTGIEDGMTGAAEGHSPTGIKQVIVRLREAQLAMREFSEAFRVHASAIEGQATKLSTKIVPVDTAALSAQRVPPGANNPEASLAQVTLHITQEGPQITVSALDNANMEEAWRNKIMPEYLRHLDNNTDQIASLTEEAAAKHRRRA